MRRETKIIALMLLAVIVLLCWFIFQPAKVDEQAELNSIRKDSLLNAAIKERNAAVALNIALADSVRDARKVYKAADSINHIKYSNAKIKIKNLSPSGRDSVRDSILRANNIPVRP